ncbi:MAG: 30S ribosomal protein S2 [Pseudomonadota bacterium]|nr:30S ribosomal protein S2 [Pseudomonadota bacterium]MEC8020216.1 30S ribosomal protein S2 [Pseudomonadota bacterium]MEC8797484.1 30S ribosomal protein S2 [Pseudomonadota bacterium]
MALPDYSMSELLEAGAHFGHQKHRWNPKMEPFIFGVRNNIHILDLSQTIPLLHKALTAVRDITKSGGRILFVGTKRQGQEIIANAANDCAQYYMNHRWYGGTLTNWKTISNTIKRLRTIEDLLENDDLSGLTKKELLKLNREKEKLDTSIGGIKDMGGLPDLIFVLDTVKEQIAIQEATKLKIPIAAIIDSNSNPDGVTYPIPGNDDSTKSISLFCDLISKAALDGIAQSQNETSADTKTAPKVTKNKNVKTKDVKSDDDKAEDKEIKKKKSDKVEDSSVKKSLKKEEDKSKNSLGDEVSEAQSDATEVKASEISEEEEK